jgi:ABC-type sugar transport system permease subunit/ABC-type glycerol-3-phosphate transport system substrate-binding protein
MTASKVARWLLALAAVLVVVWSFIDVGCRAFVRWDLARADGSVELTILHWGDNDEIQIVQTLVDAFEAENPGIRIKRLHASDYATKINTMFAAGTPPDLYYLPAEEVPKFAGMNLAAPIDDLIAKDVSEIGEDWFKEFFPVIVDAYRYDDGVIGKGPLYGLPKDFTPMLMYANLQLFQRAGVEVPYDGWTWGEFDDAMKKISALEEPNGDVYGAVIASWALVLRDIIWSHGGDYFNGSDFADVTVDEPGAIAGLDRIRRLRFDDKSAYNYTGGLDAQLLGEQEFYTGRIGVVGPIGRWRTPRFRSIDNFEWDVVPMPHTTGVERSSAIATTAWAMSSTTKHPDEAFKLMKFFSGPVGQTLTARSGLAVPCIRSVAESDEFMQPGLAPANARLFVDLIDVSRIGQLPAETEFVRILQDELDKAIRLDQLTTKQAAENVQARWLAELQSPLRNKAFPKMPWKSVTTSAIGALIVLVGGLFFWLRREKLGAIDRAQERAGWVFISPWIIGFLVLTFGPMGLSLILAMSRWTSMQPLSEAEFVGLGNFSHMINHDASFAKSVWVTTYYAMLAVPVGQILALLVAVLMNQKIKGIAFYRTVFFVPSVVSGVALATLWAMMFDKSKGIINRVLTVVLDPIGLAPPDWFGVDAEIFAIPAYVIMALWGVGAGMVIYLAGLKGIPVSLYEAARIDGAGRVRAFFSVTLPQLSPLIFFNLIMGIIGSFQVFTQVYVMTNGGPGNATLVYVLKLYREAFEYHKMGYASAMAWVLFIVLLLLTGVVIKSSKSWVHYEGLK